MAMISKVFDHITYYYEERNDATAGKMKRLHDWCNVSKGSISGWMPRPQRFVGEGANAKDDGWSSDNMADLTFDKLDVWKAHFERDNTSDPIRLHRLNEMPVEYDRTKAA